MPTVVPTPPRVRRGRVAWPWVAAVASGGLLACGFAPVALEFVAWIALAPLLAAVWFGGRDGGPHPRPFLLGWVAGLVFFYLTFHWITTVTVLGWLVFCPYLALYPAIWGWFCGRVLGTPPSGPAPEQPRRSPLPWLPGIGVPRPHVPRTVWMNSRRNLGLAAAAAAAWVAQEWLRSTLFTGFGWNTLAVVLNNNLALLQIASWTGAEGLSFLAAFVTAILVLSVRRLWDELGRGVVRPHYDFNLAMTLVVACFALGVHRLQNPGVDRTVQAVLVQPAIPQAQKWDPDYEADILGILDALSSAAEGGHADLLVWPEAATPRPALLDPDTFAWTDAVRQRAGADFLFGTLDGDTEADYNAAVLLVEGREPQVYRKRHLVPFGEYIPLRHSFPLFAWIAGNLVPGDFRAGSGPTVLEGVRSRTKIGPLICFEDTLPELARRTVLEGAELLVNVTNDGWFLESPAAEQHLANARFRAVENARPLVRCANTGVTGVFDRYGRLRVALRDDRERPFVRGTLTVEVPVPIDPERTLFARHGRWFALACCGLSALLSLAYGVRRQQAVHP